MNLCVSHTHKVPPGVRRSNDDCRPTRYTSALHAARARHVTTHAWGGPALPRNPCYVSVPTGDRAHASLGPTLTSMTMFSNAEAVATNGRPCLHQRRHGQGVLSVAAREPGSPPQVEKPPLAPSDRPEVDPASVDGSAPEGHLVHAAAPPTVEQSAGPATDDAGWTRVQRSRKRKDVQEHRSLLLWGLPPSADPGLLADM